MSTRCQIGFYEQDFTDLLKPDRLIYKHSDGYPDAVLPTLLPFLKLFKERRGLEDVEYASAWTLYHFIAEYVEWAKKAAEKYAHMPKDGLEMLGFGICDGFHGDIAYYYAVTPTSVAVYKVRGKDFDLQETHKIENAVPRVTS